MRERLILVINSHLLLIEVEEIQIRFLCSLIRHFWITDIFKIKFFKNYLFFVASLLMVYDMMPTEKLSNFVDILVSCRKPVGVISLR